MTDLSLSSVVEEIVFKQDQRPENSFKGGFWYSTDGIIRVSRLMCSAPVLCLVKCGQEILYFS